MKKRLLIVIGVLLLIPSLVFAKDYDLSIGSWFHDNGFYNMDATVNIYYAFYNKGKVTLSINGDKATMTVPADSFQHEEKYFETPEMTYTGTYSHDGNKNTIELVGTVNGTIINKFLSRINYNNTTVSKITLELTYYDSKIKNGETTVDAKARIFGTTVSRNADSPEQTNELENTPLISLKEFTISGLDGKVDSSTATKEDKKDNFQSNSTTSTKNDNGSSPLPYIFVGATVVIIGTTAFTRFIKKRDAITGEEKTYEFNPETGEYESDGSVYSKSLDDEVSKISKENDEWLAKDREKIKNRDTLSDRENKKMVDAQNKKTKELEKDIYIDRVASHNGITATDKNSIRKELGEKQRVKEKDAADHTKIVEHMDTLIDTTEKIEEAADYAIAAGEAIVPGGKVVSSGYKAIKGVAKVAADPTKNAGDVVEAVFTSGADAANVFVDNKLIKAGSTIGSNVVGKTANAAINGKDLGKAVSDGAKTGTGVAIVNAVGDEIGGALGGNGGQAVGNVAASAYQKRVVDPKMEKKLK